jgi:hypothetical protein
MSHPINSSAIPLLFVKRRPAESMTAAQYVGTDTEIDTKEPAASCDDQSRRQFPFLFGERLPAEPTMAAQYIGTDTELDTKGPGRSVHGSSPGSSPESPSVQTEMTSPTFHA